MSKQLEKYLRSRASTAPWQVSGIESSHFKAVVVIPALAESVSLPKTLASLATNPAEYLQQTLILSVVNNRVDIPAEPLQDNQQTLNWLQASSHPQINLGWVDASSTGLELPAKQGVGLARKIGFDLALSRLDWDSCPLLISLDADTLVDENYLPAIFRHFHISNCGGATLPFRHQPADSAQQEQAIRRYELYLRSYLFGLQQAGSPYAYHAIGSAFACRAAAYLKVGGMNRRSAAEDFYFLQQLAKTCGVEMLSGTLVRPSARFSERVPFGTGRAVQAQVDAETLLFRFSSAASFAVLRDWLQLLTANCTGPAEPVLEMVDELSPILRAFLQELNFTESWGKLQTNCHNRQKFIAALHVWFDGLRTRQLLSRLDAEGYQPVAANQVGRLLEWGGYPAVNDEAKQLQLLERLQGVDLAKGHCYW